MKVRIHLSEASYHTGLTNSASGPAPPPGLEPGTNALTVRRSAIELQGINRLYGLSQGVPEPGYGFHIEAGGQDECLDLECILV